MEPAIQLLIDSLKVYTPSTEESELSSLLQAKMRSLGFRNVRTDGAGNAIGEVGIGKPHLLLCGHMDTVPGMLNVRMDEEEGRIYGRGAADAKAPMCAMVSAAASGLTGAGEGLHVTVACVTREEGDSLGVNTLIDSGGDYDCAVFGEPGGANKLAVGYRGRVEARLVVQTSGGHAASSWVHASAVEEAIAIVGKIREYEAAHAVDGDHYRSVNITPTVFRGGSYSNVVPREGTVTFDIRIPPGTSSSTIVSDLRALVEERSRTRPDATFGLTFAEATEPYEAPTDSLVVRAFQRSIIRNLGARPTLTHKTGTGDMNTLAQRMGIPCATYGPGDSLLEHTDGEYVGVADYVNSIRVIVGAFEEFRTLYQKSSR